MNFYTLVESAKMVNELAIGYRINENAHDPDQFYGITLNPLKSNELIFKEEDKLIVVAED